MPPPPSGSSGGGDTVNNRVAEVLALAAVRLHLPPSETLALSPSLLGAMLAHTRKLKAIDRVEWLDLLQTAALEPYQRDSLCRKLRAQIVREHGLESPQDSTTVGDLLALYAERHCPGRLAELFDHTPFSSPSP